MPSSSIINHSGYKSFACVLVYVCHLKLNLAPTATLKGHIFCNCLFFLFSLKEASNGEEGKKQKKKGKKERALPECYSEDPIYLTG